MTNDQQLATMDYLADLIRRFEIRMIEKWNDMDRRMMRWNGMAAVPEDLPTIKDRATNDAEKQERDEEGDGDEIGEALTTSPIKDAAIKVQGEAGRKLKVDKADKTAIDEAVKKLLELKGEFKTITGGDWKPTDQKKEVKGKENKAPAPTSVKDGEKSETQKKREAKKANKKADEGGSKEDAKDDGPDVSNGKYGVQEMNQSKDKPSTVLIPVKEANNTFNNIRDKGGGGWDRTERNNCKVTKF